MIKIGLVEDQAMLRSALTALLQLEPDFTMCFSVEDGMAAKKALTEHQVDILLTDIEMPHCNGIELLEHCKHQAYKHQSIIFTTFARAGYVRRALELGCRGFVLKDMPSEQLANTIRVVHSGKRVINPELAMAALDDADPLTDKERKALQFALEGLSTHDIASKMYLSEGTVRNYLSEAISKLNAANRIDAARIAKQKGWL